jgi:hypothetical protein
MPSWVYQAAVYVVAALVVLAVVGGVASGVSSSVRRFLFGRIGGAIFLAVTEESRRADRKASAKLTTANELREALKDLGDAVFQGWHTQTEKAAARVRMLCPETRVAVDALLNDVRNVQVPLAQLHQKLDAVRDSAAHCLNV